MEQITNYLTMENIVFFFIASIAFTIVLFLIKQFSKVLAFLVFAGVMYYLWFASPVIKLKMKNCVNSSIEEKGFSDQCKHIF